MVNAPSPLAGERRERPRAGAEHAPLFAAGRNPFGDLVPLQQMSARLARGLRPVLEGVMGRELRCWAEPVTVARFAECKPVGLTAWQSIAMGSRSLATLAVDGALVVRMLDALFGGEGAATVAPEEFMPAAEAMVGRLGHLLAAPLAAAWAPMCSISCTPVASPAVAIAPDLGGDEAVVVTRFGFAGGDETPSYINILYPVAALKPFGAALAVKVHGSAEAEPEWRAGLTRAVMGVTFPVRSVLAEPVLSLGRLLALQEGDVIPIECGPDVPVMVASRRLGTGQAGTANGRAAVRLTQIDPISEEDFR
jgi:flagellar motor switch protein FliM